MRWRPLFFLVLGLICLGCFFVFKEYKLFIGKKFSAKTQIVSPIATDSITPTASPSATPTPKPLTFAEMNKLYGPCVSLPVLMYHHVELPENAATFKRTYLNVPPETFKKQMEYLNSKGYSSVTPFDLVNYFDNGVKLPSKPVMITFDDGYVDIGDLAFPIMRELGIKGTVFIPTGLMENIDYLTWAKIDDMKASGLINFGNHTWSHKNVGGTTSVVENEITIADTQLSDRGLNNPKIFAYPFGLETKQGIIILKKMGYQLAFTTVYGRTQCEKKRFDLPRIRIGNASLSSYGL